MEDKLSSIHYVICQASQIVCMMLVKRKFTRKGLLHAKEQLQKCLKEIEEMLE